jgi:hypothetical protein
MLEDTFVEVGKEEGDWEAEEDVPENFQASALAIGLKMIDVHGGGKEGGGEAGGTMVREDKLRIKPGWVTLKKLMLLRDL